MSASTCVRPLTLCRWGLVDARKVKLLSPTTGQQRGPVNVWRVLPRASQVSTSVSRGVSEACSRRLAMVASTIPARLRRLKSG